MKIKTALCALTVCGALALGAADTLNLWPICYYSTGTNTWSFNTCLGIAGGCKTQSGYRCSWMFPLWYEDDDAFYSLFYAQGAKGGNSWWTVPLLLSWGDTHEAKVHTRTEGSVLLSMVGWYSWADKNKGRNYSTWWVFPLYWWDSDGTWLTLLGGRIVNGATTHTVITPIAGITGGEHTGGWLFPLWSRYKSVDFEKKAALIDSPTLPECIPVTVTTHKDKLGKGTVTRYHGEPFVSSDETSVLLSDIDHCVLGRDSILSDTTDAYSLCEAYARGTRLVSSYRSLRVVQYDMKSRAKVSDKEVVEGGFLEWLGLYWYDYSRDLLKGGETTQHRVLWKFWDWHENAQGDFSLDVFPGFNYSSRPDGYTKTSFWWRFFRYESDPQGGTSVDFLFIPIWR